ncbi:NUDIX hydrolase [Heyndrickxia vini]|uniref:NUDIX hydrolase n=1 Tax=Heyndrickxia vini TaxID=1476025 RepID=A0ABX7E3N5_9BACI|nr:NUDIX hydrolase [Heyndrickxia vini]QQZ09905.1 NUDIX hydrolase [Heyndrickxia vini]
MRKGIIRPLVICIFHNKGSILVAKGMDPKSGGIYYRPIGGGIEYGERSVDALVREVKEEISAEINRIRYLGTVENIFTFNGELGHEIVQVYDVAFVDQSFYSISKFTGIEDNGVEFEIMWKSIEDFQRGKFRLVPEELLDLIEKI